MKSFKVAELFAGVGGFRLGFEEANKELDKTGFQVVWSNQFEPLTKTIQHASMVYENAFKPSNGTHSNDPIQNVSTSDIPDHDILVGGFPCQDYSAAAGLKNAKGIKGKKGVLWWEIYRILKEKGKDRPHYLLLENVDRLLKSPSKNRGRDFSIMLKALHELGYSLEWRVINAGEYGYPQKRRRVFILGFHKNSSYFKKWTSSFFKAKNVEAFLIDNGVMAKSFSCIKQSELIKNDDILKYTINELSNDFNNGGEDSPYFNTGLMVHGKIFTIKTKPNYNGSSQVLKDVLEPLSDVSKKFFASEEDITKWSNSRKKHRKERVASNGHKYYWAVGTMSFPDDINKPSRTITTAEGSSTPSRITHVINQGGKFRRLTPIELERLNGFPDNHTKYEGVTDGKRAFLMGNALVVGIVKELALQLAIELNDA